MFGPRFTKIMVCPLIGLTLCTVAILTALSSAERYFVSKATSYGTCESTHEHNYVHKHRKYRVFYWTYRYNRKIIAFTLWKERMNWYISDTKFKAFVKTKRQQTSSGRPFAPSLTPPRPRPRPPRPRPPLPRPPLPLAAALAWLVCSTAVWMMSSWFLV